MKTERNILLVVFVGALLHQSSLWAAEQSHAILEQIGVTRGICVVLGDAKGELAVELARDSELLIYAQSPRAGQVEATRKAADDAGFYGTRVFVDKGPFERLSLADNVADAVVAIGRTKRFSEAELMRVLRPGSKALLGREVLTKTAPSGVDDWSHPYHGPDNNPQSDDAVIRAPYLTQFLAEPRYAPVPQVAVGSGGRMFKAFGHVAFKKREEPFLNKLVAFNGYNGTMLWQRDLAEGVMIHRNTMIATPTVLYVADDKSCKVIDAATGELLDEISPPADVAGGTFWKWMGMEDGTLYALIGEQEQRDPTMRWEREAHGWPWNPISRGFNQPDKIKDPDEAYTAHPWGFGRNVLAIDPKTKKVLWSHREDEPADGRATCMKNGRIYIFRFGAYLACLDAGTGEVVWRRTPENAPELFEALGEYSNRQGASWNWRTTCYLKCSDDALYFAGPQVGKLLAVSAKDGSVLWSDPYNNFQLILREDALYAISGQNDLNSPSKKFDPLTGEVLALFDTGRRACTRPTGTSDSIFYRARGGSTRFDLAGGSPRLISPMRPPCQDGVTIANGLLYWWPYVCDCQLTLYGATCLAPAGDFDFQPELSEAERLEKGDGDIDHAATLPESPADWPTFRADNACSATTTAVVPQSVSLLWQWRGRPALASRGRVAGVPPARVEGVSPSMRGPEALDKRGQDARDTQGQDALATEQGQSASGGLATTGRAVHNLPTVARASSPWKHGQDGRATAPVAAGGLVFVGGPDGIVRAFDAANGELQWKAYTGGAIRIAPTVWKGRVFVGSADGWVYAFEAKTGRLLWRFRAAPAERKIPVYNTISSTWPASGGVLVEDGIAYVAAGIVNYDGTYVYALDAETGKVRWKNDTSGHHNRQARSGVSLQGHILLTDGKLYIAGGNAVSPAIYDAKDGRCLNDPDLVQRITQNNVLLTQAPRGWELSLLGDCVVACGRPFYAHPEYEVYDATVFSRVFLTPKRPGRDVAWVSNQNSRRVLCFDGIDRQALSRSMARPANQFLVDWMRLGVKDKPLWSRDCKTSTAVAVCANAVVIAEESKILAVNIDDGGVLWSHPLPAAPVEWGLGIDKDGRAIVTLIDGTILCFGAGGRA